MPDFANNQTEASVVAELAALSQDVRLTTVEGVPLLAVPEGITVENYESFLPAPKRMKASPSFEAAESFSAYVNLFKQDSTIIVAYRASSKVCALIDYHAKGAPAWGDHTAELTIKFHEDFTAWTGLSGSVSQVQFAEFIEDHIHNIAKPDAAVLKDMVLRFQAMKETTFRSAVNLQNGDVALTYIEDSERGNEANAKFPSELTLVLPVYEGQLPIQVNARIRYRIKDARLTFQVELVRKTEILRKAFGDILEAIENITEIKPLMGA